MKRILCCMIIVMLVFCGCTSYKKSIEDPVRFYYCTTTVTYNTAEGVVSSEVRDADGYSDDLMGLLKIYLKGPSTELLRSPFPANTDVISVANTNGVYTVTLSDDFAGLSGIDLTVACSCLSMTVMELTNAESVEIKAFSSELGGQDTIVMTKSNLLFEDTTPSETVPEQQ